MGKLTSTFFSIVKNISIRLKKREEMKVLEIACGAGKIIYGLSKKLGF